MTEKDLQEQYFDRLNREILSGIDFNKLDRSCNSQDTGYAEEVLKDLHRVFIEVYGTDTLECDGEHEFVSAPAIIQARKTGRLTVGLVDLDLESSGEHWGTIFLSPIGVVQQGSQNGNEKEINYIQENYIPYSYWYTPKIYGDIHVDPGSVTDTVASLLNEARDRQTPNQGSMEMK